jgi:DNA polymerase I
MEPLFGKKKLILVDGNHLLHRVLHIPNLQAMATEEGIPTGGVYGFLKTLRPSVVKLNGADKIIVAFDGGSSERRRALFPGYRVRPPIEDVIVPGKGIVEKDSKEAKHGMPYYELFGHQKRYVRDWVKAMGCGVIRFEEKEADDVIYRLTDLDEGRHLSVILSDDKDFLQLISDSVHVYRPIADEYYDVDKFKKDWGFHPKKYLIYKSMLTDKTDMVPGVKGIGDVYATEITNAVQKPKEIIAYCQSHKRKNVQAVASEENVEVLKRNLKLFDMRKEDFTKKEIGRMQNALDSESKIDWGTLKRISSELKLESLSGNLGKWMSPFRSEGT